MGRREAGAEGTPGVGIFAENPLKHKIHKNWAVAQFPNCPSIGSNP